MLDAENITFQQELLALYRRKVKHLVLQRAKLGVLAPFGVEEDIQEAYMQIARAKAMLRENGIAVDDEPVDVSAEARLPPAASTLDIQPLLTARRARLVADGWRDEEAYKDILLIPLPFGTSRLKRTELRDFVQRNTLRLDGFGGAAFPYAMTSHTAKMRNVSDGCDLIDVAPWPYEDWTFHTWSFTIDGTFFERVSVLEDHDTNKQGTGKILRFAWALQDIVRPMLFAQRMLTQLGGITSIVLHWDWGGMHDRYLIDERSRFGILDAAKCQDEHIILDGCVTMDTDLLTVARELAEQFIWLCNWRDFNQTAVTHDLTTMLNGTFPR